MVRIVSAVGSNNQARVNTIKLRPNLFKHLLWWHFVYNLRYWASLVYCYFETADKLVGWQLRRCPEVLVDQYFAGSLLVVHLPIEQLLVSIGEGE